MEKVIGIVELVSLIFETPNIDDVVRGKIRGYITWID